MKDILKSKTMIAVAILIIGTGYISGIKNVSAENTDNKVISKINYIQSVAQK